MNTTPFTASTCKAPLTDSAIARTLGNLSSTQDLDLGHLEPFACDVQQWRTEEGARVQFVASRKRPMFDLALRFRAGSALDGAAPGLAALALYSLDQGRATRCGAVRRAPGGAGREHEQGNRA